MSQERMLNFIAAQLTVVIVMLGVGLYRMADNSNPQSFAASQTATSFDRSVLLPAGKPSPQVSRHTSISGGATCQTSVAELSLPEITRREHLLDDSRERIASTTEVQTAKGRHVESQTLLASQTETINQLRATLQNVDQRLDQTRHELNETTTRVEKFHGSLRFRRQQLIQNALGNVFEHYDRTLKTAEKERDERNQRRRRLGSQPSTSSEAELTRSISRNARTAAGKTLLQFIMAEEKAIDSERTALENQISRTSESLEKLRQTRDQTAHELNSVIAIIPTGREDNGENYERYQMLKREQADLGDRKNSHGVKSPDAFANHQPPPVTSYLYLPRNRPDPGSIGTYDEKYKVVR